MSALVQYFSNLPAPVFRGRLLEFERTMAEIHKDTLAPREFFPVYHTFGEGVYIRRFCMQKGSWAFGKVHRHEHVAMVLKGKILSVSDTGIELLQAPMLFVVPAGTKRFVYAYEDSEYTVIQHTHERDLEKIEQELMADDYESLGLEVQKQEALTHGLV